MLWLWPDCFGVATWFRSASQLSRRRRYATWFGAEWTPKPTSSGPSTTCPSSCSAKYNAWLNQLRFDILAAQVVLEDYRAQVRASEERLRQLELQLHRCAESSPQLAMIAALQALRGVGFITAVTIVAEAGDLRRFPTAREFMAYTGLVPSEYSSGQSRHRGQITHTGNANIRFVLVQAAHNARYAPQVRGQLKQRLAGLPPDLVELAWRAQQRLHQRYRHLNGRVGRPKAVTAVARELAGFIWAIGQRMEVASA
jgi:transposase